MSVNHMICVNLKTNLTNRFKSPFTHRKCNKMKSDEKHISLSSYWSLPNFRSYCQHRYFVHSNGALSQKPIFLNFQPQLNDRPELSLLRDGTSDGSDCRHRPVCVSRSAAFCTIRWREWCAVRNGIKRKKGKGGVEGAGDRCLCGVRKRPSRACAVE